MPTAAPRRSRWRCSAATAGLSTRAMKAAISTHRITSRRRPSSRYRTQVAMTTTSTARMVRNGTPFADAAANIRSRRGASGPTSRSRRSTELSLTIVGGSSGVTSRRSSTSATSSAWQVRGVAPCQHGTDGRRPGRRSPARSGGRHTPAPVVAPRAVRAPRGADQRRHTARLPLRLLRGPAPGGQPPFRGQRAGPHQRGLPGPRRAARGGGAGRLRPAHPLGPAGRGADPVPPVPDQPVDPGAQPRVARRHGPGSGSGLPAHDPVRGHRGRHRVRARHPGHRLGRRPERALLALAGRLPRPPRLPRTRGAPRARLHLGLHPGPRGRRRGRGPPRRLRRPLLPAHTGPGAGQPDHPGRIGTCALPGRRPVHLAGRAPGPPLRRPGGRPAPALAGGRVGHGQLAARRGVALGLRGRLQPLHLARRPPDRLRPGQHPGRHSHHPRWPGGGRVRAGDHARRLRTHRRPGAVGRAGLPRRELLAAHPLRGTGLRQPRAGAAVRPPVGPPSPDGRPGPGGGGARYRLPPERPNRRRHHGTRCSGSTADGGDGAGPIGSPAPASDAAGPSAGRCARSEGTDWSAS